MKSTAKLRPKPQADILTTGLAYLGYRIIEKQLEDCDYDERRFALAGDKAGLRAVRKRRKKLSNDLFEWSEIGKDYVFDFSPFA